MLSRRQEKVTKEIIKVFKIFQGVTKMYQMKFKTLIYTNDTNDIVVQEFSTQKAKFDKR